MRGYEEVGGVYHCSPTNSTAFTECCRTAICDRQARCPACGKLIIGHDAATEGETGRIRFRYAHNKGRY